MVPSAAGSSHGSGTCERQTGIYRARTASQRRGPEVLLEEVSLGRVVAKPPTESGRHAEGHKKGLGVLRPSGGANAVAGCWATYLRQAGFGTLRRADV